MSSPPRSVVAELEGALLRDTDTFAYFMLVAFEASGLARFALLLLLWPLLRLLGLLSHGALAERAMVFAATAGVREAELEAVARAVLPKFLADDVDAAAWRVFAACSGRRVVVTRMPRVMVEAFAKKHLGAHAVVGRELEVGRRLRRATGRVRREERAVADEVRALFAGGGGPDVGLGRSEIARSFLSLCKEQHLAPFAGPNQSEAPEDSRRLPPVIFHDGRFVHRPTPLMSLVVLLWLPIGLLLAFARLATGALVPVQSVRRLAPFFGGAITVRGAAPPPVDPKSGSPTGVLFVSTHRTLMDPVAISTALGRRVSAVTYSISRLSELLSPIPTVRLSRDRGLDAARIRAELSRGDVAVCPEGTTCREPFLLRFSPLFAELTDRIVPVATNFRVGFFYPTTARGWKAMDPIFLFMNPWPVYEVTFLSQLPPEATCGGGRSAVEVANNVQSLLAATLGYECTNLTRKDKYRMLAGTDGTVSDAKAGMAEPAPAPAQHRCV